MRAYIELPSGIYGPYTIRKRIIFVHLFHSAISSDRFSFGTGTRSRHFLMNLTGQVVEYCDFLIEFLSEEILLVSVEVVYHTLDLVVDGVRICSFSSND